MSDPSQQQQQSDINPPAEFNPDDTVLVWSQALVQLVRDVQMLKAQNELQGRLIDQMEARLERLESRSSPCRQRAARERSCSLPTFVLPLICPLPELGFVKGR